MDVLERMSEIVRQNPAITVRELAARLGYAEQKSVYYWLHKNRFRGFKEFKRSVLTGVYPERIRRAPMRAVRMREQRTHYGEDFLPLAKGLSADGEPVWGGVSPLPRLTASAQAFALKWESGEYYPIFWPGDQLAVDPAASPEPGDLVLAISDELPALLRSYQTQSGPVYTHPITGALYSPADVRQVVGRVVALWRTL